ncbi:MAG TPA: hypothetical protein VML01_04645 [Bryobacterales bacterium]|nr:hypothetical protein [Bryobacterales bacterium]
MTRRLFALPAVAALLAAAAVPAAAQQAKPWIHVNVTEGADGKNVRVNLPLSVVGVALEMAPDKFFEKGMLKLKHADVSIADLRKLWTELRSAGNASLVEVDDKDSTIRIIREADLVIIKVEETNEKSKQVRIELPIKVVDALLQGEGEELNLRGAIEQLQGERGDIVRVVDGDTNVRIWIDETS